MAQEISVAFKEKLENTRCEQLLTFVKVYWSTGSIVYSEQEVLFDSDAVQYSMPALLSLGSFDVALKLNNNGTALDFSVVLDDSDGHLKLRFNKEALNGVRVDLFLNFVGLDVVDALLVGVGTINSDTISWDEAKRALSFGVEDVLVSKFVSYKAYPKMIAGQEDDVPSKYFPFVFGAPKKFPALRIQGGKSAITTHSRDFLGTPAVGAPPFTTAYILDTLIGFELNVSTAVLFYEFSEIGNAPEGKDPVTGKIHKTTNGGHIFVPDGVVVETTDVVLQPFNMSDPELVYPTGDNFDSFRFWWVDLDPAVSGNDMTNQFVDFEDWNGRPSKVTCKVLEHKEFPIASGKYRIELSHQPRWGKKETDRDPSVGNSYKDWFCDITVDVTDGSFDEGIKIRARSDYIMFSWLVNLLNYSQITRAGDKKDEVSDPLTHQEWLPITDVLATPSLSFEVNEDPEFPSKIKYFRSLWNPEEKNTNINTSTNFVWELAYTTAQYGFDEDIKPISLVEDLLNDIHVAMMIPDARNISLYITNILTAGIPQNKPPDIRVYASSTLVGGQIPVASPTITIDHRVLIPKEQQLLTVLELNPPLEYTQVRGYYSGEVFIDHTPAYLAHDGQGGVMELDSENAVDVIAWIFQVYSNLHVFTDQKNFLDVRAKVAGSRMAFGIAREVDAIALANIIAWEHKLALVFFSNSVRIVDLNKEPEIQHAFTTSNIELQSIKLGFVPTSDIITDFRFRFSITKDDTEGDVIVFNNNVSKFGKNTQFIDVLTLDNKEDVFELVQFWGNRLSRAWRTIEFKASIETLKLQPYDAVTFDIPALSTNTIVGFVDSIVYEPNSFSVTVKCTLASEATGTTENSQPVTNSSYWTGLEDLRLEGDRRVGLVSDLDGAKAQKFSLTDLNTLKPFERRL